MSDESKYTEENLRAAIADAEDKLKKINEERLAGMRCANCSHDYLKGQEMFKWCPYCGAKGPGHPDAELVDLPEGGRRH